MPWVEIGRHNFDFDMVELWTRGVEADIPSVTVGLISGRTIELTGRDASIFAEKFGEHVSSRSFSVTLPDHIGPDVFSAPDVGPDPSGFVGGTGLGVHTPTDH